MTGHRILIVEDESLIRIVLGEMLALEGFEVFEAQSGDEAIHLLHQIDPLHLVITDITMPGGADGNTVAATAKQQHPRIPVMYVTGRPDSVTNKLDSNDALIAKPYHRCSVLLIIRRLTART